MHRPVDDPLLVRRTAVRQAHPAACDCHLLDIIAEASAFALIDHGFFGDESWGGAEGSVCEPGASGLMAIYGVHKRRCHDRIGMGERVRLFDHTGVCGTGDRVRSR